MSNKIERIILVRHGYSMGNFDANNYQKYGDSEVPLHDKGWKQAIRAGDFLAQYLKENPSVSEGKPRIWTSPFLRTQQTTSGIVYGAKGFFNDCSLRETPYLVEQNFGIFSHLHDRSEQVEKMPMEAEFHSRGLGQSKFMTQKPMGDSPLDIYKNIDLFLGTLHRDASNGVRDVLCVSHGVTTRVFGMRFMHLSMRALEHFPNPHNCDVMILERQEDGKMSLFKVYDGESGEEMNVNIGEQLLQKAPKLSVKTLPEIPKNVLS
jgi:2,3-bisphosphoglycerate-dependent phosphoglycerate mutase